jgi:hypothetical protein
MSFTNSISTHRALMADPAREQSSHAEVDQRFGDSEAAFARRQSRRL